MLRLMPKNLLLTDHMSQAYNFYSFPKTVKPRVYLSNVLCDPSNRVYIWENFRVYNRVIFRVYNRGTIPF